MSVRSIVILIGGATVLANLAFGIWWAFAVGAGLAVVVLGELTGRLLPERVVSAAAAPGNPLSRREVEVALLIAQGLTSKEVGRRLFIERGTVDTHVQHIYNKLGIESRPQLAIWLMDHGLLRRAPEGK